MPTPVRAEADRRAAGQRGRRLRRAPSRPRRCKIDVTYTTPAPEPRQMEPHATHRVVGRRRLILHTANQMLSRGPAGASRDPEDAAREGAPDQPATSAAASAASCGSTLDAILAAIGLAASSSRPVKIALTRQQMFHVTTHRTDTIQRVRLGADATARSSPIGHDVFVRQLAERAGLRARRAADPHALCGAEPADAASAGAAGHAGRLLDARARRGGRAAGARMRDGRAGREARPRSRSSCASATSRARIRRSTSPISSRQLIACMREGAKRFGWDKRNREAGPGPRRPLAGRHGHGRGDPRQSAAAVQGQRAARARRHRHRADGDDRHRHRHLHHPGADRGRDAGPAAGAGAGRNRRYRLPGGRGLGRIVRRRQFAARRCSRPAQALREKLAQLAHMDPQAARFGDGAVDIRRTIRDGSPTSSAPALEADGEIQPGDATTRTSRSNPTARISPRSASTPIPARSGCGACSASSPPAASSTRRPRAPGDRRHDLRRRRGADGGMTLDPRYGYFVNHDLAEYHVPVHADIRRSTRCSCPSSTTSPTR